MQQFCCQKSKGSDPPLTDSNIGGSYSPVNHDAFRRGPVVFSLSQNVGLIKTLSIQPKGFTLSTKPWALRWIWWKHSNQSTQGRWVMDMFFQTSKSQATHEDGFSSIHIRKRLKTKAWVKVFQHCQNCIKIVFQTGSWENASSNRSLERKDIGRKHNNKNIFPVAGLMMLKSQQQHPLRLLLQGLHIATIL